MVAQKPTFLSADFTVIVHATEDIAKVEQAVGFLMSLIATVPVGLTRRYLRGHHGNMIATLSAKLPMKVLRSDTLRLLSERLSESEKQSLAVDLRGCIDEDGNLFLRFDKQEAFLGNVKLHQGDPIRFKLKFAPRYDVDAILNLCKENGIVQ